MRFKKMLSTLLSSIMLLSLLSSAGLSPWTVQQASAEEAEEATGSAAVVQKIPISRAMVHNETGFGDATRIADEQATAGDPLNGTGGNPNGFWFGAWNFVGNDYPIFAYIDLGQEYDLTNIFLYDLNVPDAWDDTDGDFRVYSGSPGDGQSAAEWNVQYDVLLKGTNTWLSKDVNIRTRYVRVEMTRLEGLIGEIVLYGSPVSAMIPLSPAMVTNESGYGDATRLVDEQRLAGDPLNGIAGSRPTTFWFGDWNHIGTNYPAYAYIDLGREYDLTHAFLYDFNDPGTWDDVADKSMRLQTGTPDGGWTHLAEFGLSGSEAWLRKDLSVRARYVRVELALLATITSELALYGSPVSAELPNKLPLNVSMVYSESGGGDHWKLVDEQDLAGNPLTGTNVNTTSRWLPASYPGAAYIDLGQPYHIQNISLRDVTGIADAHIYSGSPGNWELLLTDKLRNNNFWNMHPTDIISRYVRVELTSNQAGISEIVLYGTPLPQPILLSADMLVNPRNLGAMSNLVDEQSAAGNPLLGTGGAPATTWIPTFTDTSYPVAGYIDLGTEYKLTNIAIRDAGSVADVRFYSGNPESGGTPASWNLLFTDGLKNNNTWNTHPVSVTTRYVQMELAGSGSRMAEVLIYGTPLSGSLPDTKKPADITNLRGISSTINSVTLKWKAPGDDGFAGSADRYDIRYSTSEITEAAWETATPIAAPPVPVGGGTSQTFAVTGLAPGTTYYFAMYAYDEANNASTLSNVASYQTRMLDTISPGKVEDLEADFVSGNAIRLTWSAPGDDGAVGAASSYDIRYSTEPITADNWADARRAAWVPVPGSAGSKQTAWFYGLTSETGYYFALRAADEAEAGNVSPMSNVATAATLIAAASEKIDIDPELVINERTKGNARLLVDEGGKVGDPRGDSGQSPDTVWDVGSNSLYLPASAIIDLGAEYELTDIYLYDTNSGSGSVSIEVGDPFNWQPVLTDPMNLNNAWSSHAVDITTRYLRIGMAQQTSLAEVVVYGAKLGETTDPPAIVKHPRPLMEHFIGMNAFIDDPHDVLQVAGFIREYHSWNWDEGDLYPFGQIYEDRYPGYPNNEHKFAPSYAGGGSWNFDNYYQTLKSNGITVAPVAGGGSVSWLTTAKSHKPLLSGFDSTDPNAYAAHADHMFQFAARYGSTAVDDSLLKLASGQPRSSGLGTLNYFENWNEPDRWWESRISHYSPYELSAMTSADYDGHLTSMGTTFGVKNADPNAKLVLGGLADPNLEYVRAMKFWSDHNRGGNVPFDVINIHHYSNDGTNQSNGTIGISPEEDDLKGLLQSFVDYRDQYMPGKEVWITEFGYDTHPESPQRAPQIGPNSQEEVQAQWIIRSYLAAAAAGIDKAAMYMVRDVDVNSTTKFDTSGLTRGKNENWSKKPSWYYVYTMKNTLAGFRFDRAIDSGDSDVWIYKFVNETDNKAVYAVWSPTSDNTKVDGFNLMLDGSPNTATLVKMKEGSTEGEQSELALAARTVTVDVSERPVFIVANDAGALPPNTSPFITQPNGEPISITAGSEVRLVVAATDAEHDIVTYSVTGLPDGADASLDEETGEFLWTAPAVGTYTLTFTATDEAGLSDSIEVIVTIRARSGGGETTDTSGNGNHPINTAPVISKGSIHVKEKIDGYGHLVAGIGADQIHQAMADIVEGESLVIRIRTVDTSAPSSISISLPAAALAKTVDKQLKLVVDTDLMQVSIQPEALRGAMNQGKEAGTLTINLKKTTPLAHPEVRNRPVYELVVLAGDAVIDAFGKPNALTVTLPYALKSGESAHKIAAYRITKDGTMTAIKTGGYNAANGTLELAIGQGGIITILHRHAIFSDLSGARWAQASIETLFAKDIVKGKGQYKFDPQGTVTRAEFLTMLANALDLKDKAHGTSVSPFTDVPDGQWYSEAIAAAASLGIANGKSDGKFGINEAITREDIAVMLYRSLGSTQQTGATAFTDSGNISGYAVEAVNQAASAGLLHGFEDGSFKPQAFATRAQAAVLIHRLLERIRNY